MSSSNKALNTFQKLKAPIRETLLYQAIFHPIRSLTKFIKSLKENIGTYDGNPIYTALADKLKAKIYIAYRLQGFTQDNMSTIRERERERERDNFQA